MAGGRAVELRKGSRFAAARLGSVLLCALLLGAGAGGVVGLAPTQPARATDLQRFKVGPVVDPYREVMIKHLSVVEDPQRTTGCGAWTFCALMTALASTTPYTPETLTYNWLLSMRTNQAINGDVAFGRPTFIDPIISSWPRKADNTFDLTRSPFRLLAIVNRFDLMRSGDFGEGRFVFGLLNAAGQKQDFTVIFEYRMSTALWTRRQWASEWHKLGGLGSTTAAYRTQLQLVTDRFARTASGGKIQLAQLRTQLFLSSGASFGDLREFWQPAANAQLAPTTVKQTPKISFECRREIRDFIIANEQGLLNHSGVVVGPPLSLGARDAPFNLWTEWDCGIPPPPNPWAEVNFSLLTCGGCHGGSTKLNRNWGSEQVFMIRPRNAGQESTLHPFFFNQSLCIGDHFTHIHGSPPNIPCNVTFVQNDLQRRVDQFRSQLAAMGLAMRSDPLQGVPHPEQREPGELGGRGPRPPLVRVH